MTSHALPARPLVSVLTTAYNAEAWLGEALDSAVEQTWQNIEVIVVDDGSTDATLSVARRFESARVKVIHQPNAGACAARNRALAEAQGDLIQYLDADDVLAHDKIERQVRRLKAESPNTVASGPWVRFYGGDVSTADVSWRGPDWQDYEPAFHWLVQSWEGRGTIPTFAWLTPRSLIEQAGPWNEGVLRNQDGEYFTRMLVNARKITFVEGAWGYYRSGIAGSVSRREGEDVLRSLYEASALCERTLLARADTQATRRACAGLWQQFLFMAYPDVPDLVRRAEERVEELGGMYRKPGVSRPFRPVRDLLGWKPALRLQRAYVRSGLQQLVLRVKP
jgi:glycosyltransferase involved in cell wall biosynthesis